MQRHRKRSQRPGDLITAAELASFVYCPEQWRLEQALGLVPVNQMELAAGEVHHARKAVAERIAGGSINLGANIAGAALLVLAAAVLLMWVWR